MRRIMMAMVVACIGVVATSSAVAPAHAAATAPGTPVPWPWYDEVDLTWPVPVDAGSGALVDYIVQYSTNGGGTWTTAADEISTDNATRLTGLTIPGAQYSFRVAALTSTLGPFSAASSPVSAAPLAAETDAQSLPTRLRVSDTTPTRGGPITVHDSQLTPGSWVRVTIDGSQRALATVRASDSGTIDVTASIGGDITLGAHTIATIGIGSQAGAVAGSRATVNVVATDDGVTTPSGTSGTGITPVSPPVRLFDTRAGQPQGAITIDQHRYGGTRELTVKVVGAAGVPANAGAVSLNVTAVDPAGDGYVTVYPCGTRPNSSNVNYTAGRTVANAVIAPLSTDGSVCIYSQADTDLVADVNGWFAAGVGFGPLTPVRLFDTRPDQPDGAVVADKHRVGGATALVVKVLGNGGVPSSGVGAVSLNVTAVGPTAAGYVTVYPCGTRPTASNVNYTTGRTVANAVIAPVAADGSICIYSQAPTDLVADVNGWFAASAGFIAVTPVRVFDTRAGEAQGSVTVTKHPYGGVSELQVKVVGTRGVPASGVGAVSLNLTAVGPVAAGYVTVYPCGTRPTASSLNAAAGQTVANAVITPVSADGSICIYAQSNVDLVADVNGWFAG
ncbi:MAG: hypothetical protein JWM34_2714 [Ilumatobacteraceae bacterium]|nr:hypothetical protein [Ilumatobacteraceae bacterium]